MTEYELLCVDVVLSAVVGIIAIVLIIKKLWQLMPPKGK